MNSKWSLIWYIIIWFWMFPKVHVAKDCCLRSPIKIESPRESWGSWEVAFACGNRNDTFLLDGRRWGVLFLQVILTQYSPKRKQAYVGLKTAKIPCLFTSQVSKEFVRINPKGMALPTRRGSSDGGEGRRWSSERGERSRQWTVMGHRAREQAMTGERGQEEPAKGCGETRESDKN